VYRRKPSHVNDSMNFFVALFSFCQSVAWASTLLYPTSTPS
jgi:hypothetical protein